MTAPFGREYDHPETRAAVRAYRSRAFRLVLGAIIAVALAEGIDVVSEDTFASIALAFGGVFAFAWGLMALTRSIWVVMVLRRNPWQERRSLFRVVPVWDPPWPVLLVEEEGTLPEAVFSVSTSRFRVFELDPVDGGHVWLARGNRRWAIASPPGGTSLLVVRRPRLARLRRKYRSWVTQPIDPAERERERSERNRIERTGNRWMLAAGLVTFGVLVILGDVLDVI